MTKKIKIIIITVPIVVFVGVGVYFLLPMIKGTKVGSLIPGVDECAAVTKNYAKDRTYRDSKGRFVLELPKKLELYEDERMAEKPKAITDVVPEMIFLTDNPDMTKSKTMISINSGDIDGAGKSLYENNLRTELLTEKQSHSKKINVRGTDIKLTNAQGTGYQKNTCSANLSFVRYNIFYGFSYATSCDTSSKEIVKKDLQRIDAEMETMAKSMCFPDGTSTEKNTNSQEAQIVQQEEVALKEEIKAKEVFILEVNKAQDSIERMCNQKQMPLLPEDTKIVDFFRSFEYVDCNTNEPTFILRAVSADKKYNFKAKISEKGIGGE